MKKTLVSMVFAFFCMSSFGQYEKGDISVGGNLNFYWYQNQKELLKIEPQVLYNITDKTSVGLSGYFLHMFALRQKPSISLESFLRHQIFNKKHGLHIDLGCQIKNGEVLFIAVDQSNISPKIGVGFNYFINPNVVLDIVINNYLYKRELNFTTDRQIAIYLNYKM